MNLQVLQRAVAAGLLLAALAAPVRRDPGVGLGLPWLGAAPLAAQLPAPAVSSPRPFHVGGYGSVVLANARYGTGPASSDMLQAAAAIMVSGSFGRASYFGEYEPASRNRENWSARYEDRASSLERLYLEYAFGDALRLRVGRFLTPVGQWNEIHAEPLTWTALRPLSTYRPFSKSANGIMLAGTLPIGRRDAGYAVFVSPVRVGGDQGQETSFSSAGGGRIAIEVLPQLYIGASILRFRASRPLTTDNEGEPEGTGGASVTDAAITRAVLGDLVRTGTPPDSDAGGREEDTGPRTLFGGDASFTTGRLELLAEAVALSNAGGEAGLPAERGGFIQAALRVLPLTHLVARAERYGPLGYPGGDLDIFTLGATVRPQPHLTLKLDRQFSSRRSNRVADGWFVSASAMF